MAVFELPLSPEAQKFTVNLAGTVYRVTLYWNAFSSRWCLDFFTEQGARLLSGVPLVANTNLLEQFGYLNFNGSLVAITDDDINAAPTYENLGSTSHVYFMTSD